MTLILVNRSTGPSIGTAPTSQFPTRPKNRMLIMPQTGKADEGLAVRYAPRSINYTSLSDTWSEITRSGRRPLLARTARPRPRMGFTLFFGDKSGGSVSDEIRRLTQFANSDQRLIVNYSSWESGLWRIASLNMTSEQRSSRNDEITQATVDIEFILASDVAKYVGLTSGGVKPPPQSGGKKKKKPRTYVVKKGDSLHSIAIKFYKDASKWKKIAKANKITNPRSKRQLKVGRKLRIPA